MSSRVVCYLTHLNPGPGSLQTKKICSLNELAETYPTKLWAVEKKKSTLPGLRSGLHILSQSSLLCMAFSLAFRQNVYNFDKNPTSCFLVAAVERKITINSPVNTYRLEKRVSPKGGVVAIFLLFRLCFSMGQVFHFDQKKRRDAECCSGETGWMWSADIVHTVREYLKKNGQFLARLLVASHVLLKRGWEDRWSFCFISSPFVNINNMN